MEAWGVEFRTVAFVTAKDTQLGNWTRANAEIVLLGVRGKPKRVDAGVHQVVVTADEVVLAQRSGLHSRKPSEIRERINRLMGPGVDKIELTAEGRMSSKTC